MTSSKKTPWDWIISVAAYVLALTLVANVLPAGEDGGNYLAVVAALLIGYAWFFRIYVRTWFQ